MAANSKFLFDTPFDEELSVTGRGANGGAAASGRAFGDETVSHKAVARAHQEGKEEALRSVEADLAAAATEIAAGLAQLVGDRAHYLDRFRDDSVALAVAIARKLAPALMAREPLAEVEGMIADCLKHLQEEPRVAIRAAQSMIDQLKPRIEALGAGVGATGKMILIGDASLGPRDCRVEWAEGAAERREDEVAAALDAAIARFLERTE